MARVDDAKLAQVTRQETRTPSDYIQTMTTSTGSSYKIRAGFYLKEIVAMDVKHAAGDPVRLSDALFDTWKRGLNGNLTKCRLGWIVDRTIHNQDTQEVLQKYRANAQGSKLSFPSGSVGFQQILETKLGKSKPYMLNDYRNELGNRQITRIDVEWVTQNAITSITYHLDG